MCIFHLVVKSGATKIDWQNDKSLREYSWIKNDLQKLFERPVYWISLINNKNKTFLNMSFVFILIPSCEFFVLALKEIRLCYDYSIAIMIAKRMTAKSANFVHSAHSTSGELYLNTLLPFAAFQNWLNLKLFLSFYTIKCLHLYTSIYHIFHFFVINFIQRQNWKY